MGAIRNMNWTRFTPAFTVRLSSDPYSKSRELVNKGLILLRARRFGVLGLERPRVKRSVMDQSLYVLFMNFLRDSYGFSDVMAV